MAEEASQLDAPIQTTASEDTSTVEGQSLLGLANTDETQGIVPNAEGEAKPTEGEVVEGEVVATDEPIEYDLKLADGALIDEAGLNRVKEFAEANKLSNEVAQAILDRQGEAIKAYEDTKLNEWDQEAVKNLETIKNHPEMGGANLNSTDVLTTAVLNRFAPEGFMQLLHDSQMGLNPMFVEMLYNIGKASAPDTLHLGSGKLVRDDSRQGKADRLFGKTN